MAEFWGFDQVDTDGLIFTSYNSLDWRRVAPVALELRKLGVPVWYDYGLEAGTSEWGTQITRHIKKSSALVIFVTKGIFDREESYVIEEYEEAKMYGKPVIPVFLDNVVAADFFVNVDEKYARYITGWNRLQGVAYSPAATPESLAQTIKHRLDNSSQITYKAVPWVDREAEREAKAEAARAAARLEAEAEERRKAAESASRAAQRTEAKIGARVAFGSYPQSSNTPEPIMWRVLDIIDGKALMISESLLDCKRYNESEEIVTWETCTLRRWLNGEFMSMAFNAEECNKLSRVKVPNPENQSYGTEGGSPTEDYAFCLSIDEANKYFGGDEDRKAKPTAVARKNGCYVSSVFGTGWWWLRSPGVNSSRAANVDSDGGIGGLGSSVHNDDFGVRPVVLARL